MKYEISKDRKTLTIFADKNERKILRDMPDEGRDAICTDDSMYEFFEHLTCNSELEWINPEETGDLTSAPILGILGEEVPDTANRFEEVKLESLGMRLCGQNGLRKYFEPILERWAFMDYQIRSPLEDLRDKGKVVFVS